MALLGWGEFIGAVWRAHRKTRGSHCLASSPLRFVSRNVRSARRRGRISAQLGTPIPAYCMLSITARCNLKCAGCYAQRFGSEADMKADTMRRILSECESLGILYVLVVGGEPLMVPGLLDTISSYRNTVFLLYTNGSLVEPKHVAQIARCPNILPIVSIEGDAAQTDGRRGENVFVGVERTMRMLRDARVVFGFCSMVTHLNLRTVTSRPWLDWMWDHGAVMGILSDYTPYPDERDEELSLTPDDRSFKTDAVASRKREARPYVINFPADEYAWGGCGSAGRDFIHINPEGFLEPCPLVRYAADNMDRTSLREGLASPFFTQLRARSDEWTHDGQGCLLLDHEDELRAIAEQTGASSTRR